MPQLFNQGSIAGLIVLIFGAIALFFPAETAAQLSTSVLKENVVASTISTPRKSHGRGIFDVAPVSETAGMETNRQEGANWTEPKPEGAQQSESQSERLRSPLARGSRMVAGAFSFSSSGGELYEIEKDRLFILQLNPSVNIFVAPGLAVGGKLLLSSISQGENWTIIWGAGPQVLFYFGGTDKTASAKGATYPYVGASFLVTRSAIEVGTFNEFDQKSGWGTTISYAFGLNHMVTNTVGLFGELGYQVDTLKYDDGGDWACGNRLTIFGGIVFYLY